MLEFRLNQPLKPENRAALVLKLGIVCYSFGEWPQVFGDSKNRRRGVISRYLNQRGYRFKNQFKQ
jgi:hypothetical protein